MGLRRAQTFIRVEDTVLRLSNIDKVLFPVSGVTKGQLIKYYQALGPVVLPHLRDRPFTLNRFPGGLGEPSFFEKQCPSHRPNWVQTGEFEGVHYCLINDLKTLVWAANLAAIELHTTLGRLPHIEYPTLVAFDLDPGEGMGLKECCVAALLVQKELDRQGLETFAKTSGKKGLHVYLPLDGQSSYEAATPFVRKMAEKLERAHPDFITSKMKKSLRPGKIFIDWSQNVDFKTTVTAYSVRAVDPPCVSTPLFWREVREASHQTSIAEKLLSFSPQEVLYRLRLHGDIFAAVLSRRQSLSAARSA